MNGLVEQLLAGSEFKICDSDSRRKFPTQDKVRAKEMTIPRQTILTIVEYVVKRIIGQKTAVVASVEDVLAME